MIVCGCRTTTESGKCTDMSCAVCHVRIASWPQIVPYCKSKEKRTQNVLMITINYLEIALQYYENWMIEWTLERYLTSLPPSWVIYPTQYIALVSTLEGTASTVGFLPRTKEQLLWHTRYITYKMGKNSHKSQ